MRALVLALALAGCGVTMPQETVMQPRALTWGLAQPVCFFLCSASLAVQDSEGSTALGSGDISLARSSTLSSSLTASPSLSKTRTSGDAAPPPQ